MPGQGLRARIESTSGNIMREIEDQPHEIGLSPNHIAHDNDTITIQKKSFAY